jgi:hypothetical protein
LMARRLLSWLVVKLERFVMGDGLMLAGLEVNNGNGRVPSNPRKGQIPQPGLKKSPWCSGLCLPKAGTKRNR